MISYRDNDALITLLLDYLMLEYVPIGKEIAGRKYPYAGLNIFFSDRIHVTIFSITTA